MPCQNFDIERDLEMKLVSGNFKPFHKITVQEATKVYLCFSWREQIEVPEYIIDHVNRLYENNQIKFEDVQRYVVKICIQEGICYHPIENTSWEQLGKYWNEEWQRENRNRKAWL